MDIAIVDATCRALHEADPLSPSRYTMPIANAPLMAHVLTELDHSGIARARVVTTPAVRPHLERALGHAATGRIELSFAETPPAGARDAVLRELRRALDRGPVLLHPGDTLFHGQLGLMRERYRSGDLDLVLPEAASVATRRDRTDGRLSGAPLLLGPELAPLLDELLGPGADGEDLIAALLHSRCRLAVCDLIDPWTWHESTTALLAGNRVLLDALPEGAPSERLAAAREVRGRVAVGHGAFVDGSIIHGPVAIAERAVLEDCYVGPYTAIGRDAVLSGTEIENSMVLAGAEIRHPGQRIEGSIVGERARVGRSFALPHGMHLRLGPDSELTIS